MIVKIIDYGSSIFLDSECPIQDGEYILISSCPGIFSQISGAHPSESYRNNFDLNHWEIIELPSKELSKRYKILKKMQEL